MDELASILEDFRKEMIRIYRDDQYHFYNENFYIDVIQNIGDVHKLVGRYFVEHDNSSMKDLTDKCLSNDPYDVYDIIMVLTCN